MAEFYRKHEEEITPVGLNFFQTEWEPCVKETYHNILSESCGDSYGTYFWVKFVGQPKK